MIPYDTDSRIIKGMQNKYTTLLAHPTCRLIRRREPFELDIEKIIESSVETGTSLEINSFPDRLDLNDANSKLAKERGAKFIIGTDAHTINHLSFMKYGIATARRGWLEKKDILNIHTLNQLQKLIGK